jgi:hypothetical protein
MLQNRKVALFVYLNAKKNNAPSSNPVLLCPVLSNGKSLQRQEFSTAMPGKQLAGSFHANPCGYHMRNSAVHYASQGDAKKVGQSV